VDVGPFSKLASHRSTKGVLDQRIARNAHYLDRDQSRLRSRREISQQFPPALVLSSFSVRAPAWTFFFSFREWPLSKGALPLRHLPAVGKS
jgi:hypothetical protein